MERFWLWKVVSQGWVAGLLIDNAFWLFLVLAQPYEQLNLSQVFT